MNLPTQIATLLAALLVVVSLPLTTPASAQNGGAHAEAGGRVLTFTDIMKIRQIEQPSISDDGHWIAFTAEPDRGDPEVIVRSTENDTRYVIALGSHPVISSDGEFVAVRVNPSMAEVAAAERDDSEDGEPKQGMALLSTATGEVFRMGAIRSFAFSADGDWFAYHHFELDDSDEDGAGHVEGEAEGEPAEAPHSEGDEDDEPAGKRKTGTLLVLRELSSGREIDVDEARAYALDGSGRYVAYSVASANSERDGLYVRDLHEDGAPEQTVTAHPLGHYGALTWSEEGSALAFVGTVEDKDGEAGPGSLMTWDRGEVSTLVSAMDAPDGWFVPTRNSLEWSADRERLFFEWRPMWDDEVEHFESMGGGHGEGGEASREGEGEHGEREAASGASAVDESVESDFDPYDTEDILADRGVDVWHWMDPRINPQQKVLWPRVKEEAYTAVYHMDSGEAVAIGEPAVPATMVPEHGDIALMASDVPYRREFTWMGGQSDLLIADLRTGERTTVAERLQADGPGELGSLSPEGRFVAYYDDGDYHLYDTESGTTWNATHDLGVPIADEDHDYPNEAPGYGIGGWLEDDAAILIYDKYDIWVVPTDGSAGWNLTEGQGRAETRIFRVVDTDPDTEAIGDDETLLLSSYHDLRKNHGFYSARADRPGVTRLLEEDRKFEFLSKAEDADAILFTRESFEEFPDLWVAEADLEGARKITDVNPEIAEFRWGTAELVEWESLDGRSLQGVVIKPEDYDPNQRYPVLVYYYRFFSQRLHEFNEPAINHRPNFPFYASNGYVVFLPDVRFEVGRPGFSSTKSVVPGVQHLIDIGIADPDAIALHGHSWSGYQTAFMITQTNIFKTAIAGAPVSNMTSAYSGIRWGSGLARQFQYEKSQSRLSGSLWEARDEYIDNSPIFFADRIETPVLIMHGDADGAVPWYQSIEFYLALRRLNKEAVFLQYRDEPHHPQRYANKLDYSIKMKEWLDYYLKGEPAADWIREGVPYRGN